MDRKLVKISEYNQLKLIAKYAAVQLFQMEDYMLMVKYIAENNVRSREQLLKCVDNTMQINSDRELLITLLEQTGIVSVADTVSSLRDKAELPYYTDNIFQFPSKK